MARLLSIAMVLRNQGAKLQYIRGDGHSRHAPTRITTATDTYSQRHGLICVLRLVQLVSTGITPAVLQMRVTTTSITNTESRD